MLPYFNYQNRLKLNHGVPHCLDMRNGYRVAAELKTKSQSTETQVAQVAQNYMALYVFDARRILITFNLNSKFADMIHC